MPDTIIELNTGLNSTGTLINSGTFDPRWVLESAPSAVIVGSAIAYVHHPSYTHFDPEPDSLWIFPPTTPYFAGNWPNGNYTYKITFDLDRTLYDNYRMNLFFGNDNAITSITLNGTALSLPSPDYQYTGPAWRNTSSTTNDSLFLNGTNTLKVVVNNYAPSQSPTGLTVKGSIIADWTSFRTSRIRLRRL